MFYSLDVILAVGYRVKSPRGTQFRQWATKILHEFLQKGFVRINSRHPTKRNNLIMKTFQYSIAILFFLAFFHAQPLSAQIPRDQYITLPQSVTQPPHQPSSRQSAGVNPTGEIQQTNWHTEALLVGINKYTPGEKFDYSPGKDLKGCVNDVDAVEEKWLKLSDKPENIKARVTTLTKKSSLEPADPKKVATPKNFLDALDKKIAIRCDRLIIFFSGHGAGFSEDATGKKSYLAFPLSADTDANTEKVLVKDKRGFLLVPVRHVLEKLRQAKAKEVLVIFDCCRNTKEREEDEKDFMLEFTDIARQRDQILKRPNGGAFAIITACSFGEKSQELCVEDSDPEYPIEKNCGAFIHYFLRGLDTRDADRDASYDGSITLTEAFNYASKKTTEKILKRGKWQSPEIFMASTSQNMTLFRYSLVDKSPKKEDETDIQFLLRAGQILANNRYIEANNRLGRELLDCALQNVTHDSWALAARASINRKLGDHENALRDIRRINGWEFQLYAKNKIPTAEIQLTIPGQTPEQTAAHRQKLFDSIGQDSLLTIENIESKHCLVTKIDNRPLHEYLQLPADAEIECSIPINRAYWTRQTAENTIVRSPMQPNYRTTSPLNIGGVGRTSPGLGPWSVRP